MPTLVTKITERGQASVPALVRKKLGLRPGTKLVWEAISENEARVRVQTTEGVVGPVGVLGYARTFREVRSTTEWMRDLREGEKD